MGDLYRAFGLMFDSEYELPGALPVTRVHGVDGGSADVAILRRSIPTSQWRDRRGLFALLGEALVVSLPGCGNFLCDRGDAILVDPVSGANDDEIGRALCAFALPALLWIRGEVLLHAGAAVLPATDKAIVIAGHIGSGKSTILQELVRLGAQVLADDVVCLSRQSQVSGLPAILNPRRDGSACDRRHCVVVPVAQRCGSAVLGAIYTLSIVRSTERATIASLLPEQCVQALLEHRYRPRVPRILGLARNVLPHLGCIARSVPMYEWQRCEGRLALQDSEFSALAEDRDCPAI